MPFPAPALELLNSKDSKQTLTQDMFYNSQLCINKTDFKKGPGVYSLPKMGLRNTNVSTCTQWLEVGESRGLVGFVSSWQSQSASKGSTVC